MAITGTPWRLATRATPIGVLPWIDWLSSRPSPVITKSASRTASSRRRVSVTISMPGRKRALSMPSSAAPMPPAAPRPAG